MAPNQPSGGIVSVAPEAIAAPAEEKHAGTEILRMFGLGPCGPLCEGKLTAVRSTCRPGEVDITVRCSDCAEARHFVRTVNGAHLSDSEHPEKDLLSAFRNPPLEQLGPQDQCHWGENAGQYVIIRAADPDAELHPLGAELAPPSATVERPAAQAPVEASEHPEPPADA